MSDNPTLQPKHAAPAILHTYHIKLMISIIIVGYAHFLFINKRDELPPLQSQISPKA
jgi:hypothetical protein